MVCPIYAALSPEEQLRVFESTPKDTRKVILSTNIAETSITIRGIRFDLQTDVTHGLRMFPPSLFHFVPFFFLLFHVSRTKKENQNFLTKFAFFIYLHRLVLDCGLVKARAFNPRTGIDILAVVPISKSAASQRTGRAGRESPGVCFRLYTQEDFEKLEEATIPEIRRYT